MDVTDRPRRIAGRPDPSGYAGNCVGHHQSSVVVPGLPNAIGSDVNSWPTTVASHEARAFCPSGRIWWTSVAAIPVKLSRDDLAVRIVFRHCDVLPPSWAARRPCDSRAWIGLPRTDFRVSDWIIEGLGG
jgi:hypothetical protein